MEQITLLGKRSRYETQATPRSLLMQLEKWENETSRKESVPKTFWMTEQRRSSSGFPTLKVPIYMQCGSTNGSATCWKPH